MTFYVRIPYPITPASTGAADDNDKKYLDTWDPECHTHVLTSRNIWKMLIEIMTFFAFKISMGVSPL